VNVILHAAKFPFRGNINFLKMLPFFGQYTWHFSAKENICLPSEESPAIVFVPENELS
jgi:hypothetical protein